MQYLFETALDSGFTLGFQSSGWQNSAVYVPQLTPNSYYWHVKARDAALNETPFTSPWQFSTTSFPSAPQAGVPLPLSTTAIRWLFTDTATNEDGFVLHDAANSVKATGHTPNASYIDETGLTPDTLYARHIHAYGNASGESPASGTVSAYTLALPPDVTSDRATSHWFNTADVTFTNKAGFGSGGVEFYRIVWDQNPGHTFTGSEEQWSGGVLTKTATVTGSWYLHVASYNAAQIANGSHNYGPYYYDGTAPAGLSNAAPASGSAGLETVTVLSLNPATDSDSGGVQY